MTRTLRLIRHGLRPRAKQFVWRYDGARVNLPLGGSLPSTPMTATHSPAPVTFSPLRGRGY